jgi:hypothetical protein
MARPRRGDAGSGSYDQAHKLRRGRQLWTGDSWAEVTAVWVTGEGVLITVADGRVFRAGYADAVLSRKKPTGSLTAYCWPSEGRSWGREQPGRSPAAIWGQGAVPGPRCQRRSRRPGSGRRC